MMRAIFPNPFKAEDSYNLENEHLNYTVDSGKNALRISLKSFNLPAGVKVAVPAFSCNAVTESVIEENFTPVFLDLKSDNTYWTDYDPTILLAKNVEVLILTHLYGFLHPDTINIINFCRRHSIKVIHDAAQSYGINITALQNDIIVYSFSSGKSSSAAAGGEICNLIDSIELQMPPIVQRVSARSFFCSRFLDCKYPRANNFLTRFISKIVVKSAIYDMSAYQKIKALQSKYIVKRYGAERIQRYETIKKEVLKNSKLKIAYDDDTGLYFKMVIYVQDDVENFVDYLNKNKVLSYRLAKDINMRQKDAESLPVFFRKNLNFVEVSTERSIELIEISRVAEIIGNYK